MEKTEQKNVRSYEISFLLRAEEDAQVIVKHLSDNGAEIVSEGTLSHIKLAYPIKRENEAYFGFIHFDADPDVIVKLNHEFEIEDKVLRALIVTPPFVKQAKRRFMTGQGKEESETEKRTHGTEGDLSNAALEEKIEEMSAEKDKTTA
jgi:ribosomal protein S6